MRFDRSIPAAILFLAVAAAAQEPAPEPISRRGDLVSIQLAPGFQIKDLLDDMSRALGKPVLYDPDNQRIRGRTIGAEVSQKVPAARMLDSFRSILAYYEIYLVPVGPRGYEIYLAVDTRSTNNLVKNKALQVDFADLEQYADRDGVYISCAIPVRSIGNLSTLRTALSTMVSPAGIGRVHEVPGTGSLVVMDFAPTVVAIARLVRQMDLAPDAYDETLEVIELEYARAPLLAAALGSLLLDPEPAQAGAQRRTVSPGQRPRLRPRIVAYEPRNALAVRAMKRDMERIRALVAELDRPDRTWTTPAASNKEQVPAR